MPQPQNLRTEIILSNTDEWRDYIRENHFQCDASRACNKEVPLKIEMFGSLMGEVFIYELNHSSASNQDKLNLVRNSKHIAADGMDYYALGYSDQNMQFEQGGKVYELTANNLCLFDTTQPYHVRQGYTQSGFIVFFKKAMLEKRFAIPDRKGPRIISEIKGTSHLLYSFCVNNIREMPNIKSQQAERVIVDCLAALTNLVFNPSADNAEQSVDTCAKYRYQEALNCIDNNLHLTRLSQNMIAKQMGISRSYLVQLFNKNDTSFTEQLRVRRMEKAARALTSLEYSRMSILEIAECHGFINASHFSRCFSQYFGISPKAYRLNGICKQL